MTMTHPTTEQVDDSRLYALRLEALSLAAHSADGPCRRFAEQVAPILDAYAATLKAAQGGVSEAVVEQAISAYSKIVPDDCMGLVRKKAMRAALEAALSAEPAAQGDAVAWRYRHPKSDGGWHDWIYSGSVPHKRYAGSEYQPLCIRADTSLVPVAWQIRARGRDWETCTGECYDETLRTGRYRGLPSGTNDVEARALYTAPPAQPADSKVIGDDSQIKPGERVPEGWRVLQIGAVGSAYDPPNTRRAFTYDWQPGNGAAWALGKASSSAAKASAGDYIDGGLNLLKALQEQGFGVFQIEPSAPAAPAEEGVRMCKLGCEGYCKAKAHGCASECPNPGAAR